MMSVDSLSSRPDASGVRLVSPASTLAAAALLLVLFASLVFAQDGAETATSLSVGTRVERTLAASRVDSFTLPADRGDFIGGLVKPLEPLEPLDADVELTLFGPDRQRIRRFSGGAQAPLEFYFVATAPGSYHLEMRIAPAAAGMEVAGTEATVSHVRYEITLEHRTPAAPAAAPTSAGSTSVATKRPLESPALERLRQQVAAGQTTTAFWQEIATRGAPLVEQAGDHAFLVTFLWRHTDETRRVRLFWPVRAVRPTDDELERLEGTDVWFKTLRAPRGTRMSYQLAINVPATDAARERRRRALLATAQADPLNAKRWPDLADADIYATSSVLETPGAPARPWEASSTSTSTSSSTSTSTRVEHGALTRHRLSSVLLRNTREVYVYTPPGYRADGPASPLLVLFDAEPYLKQVQTPLLLDALIAGRRVRPAVAVFIGNAAGDSRGRELPPNPTFAKFLAEELLPWIQRGYRVSVDPSQVIVSGSSYGGLAATYAAMTYPHLFGNVLSQSGSYWWSPAQDPARPEALDEFSEPNWFARELASRPTLPVRFYLNAGLFETGSDILQTTRHVRDVLIARGYEVHYESFAGGHDYLSWRDGLANGLITLLPPGETGGVPAAQR
jgi:enterochelin esterase family protein